MREKMRGGKRIGAGRTKGVPNKKTAIKRAAHDALVAEAKAAGVLPLEVMLTAMRRHFEAGDWDKAAELAKDAAPYVHPRISAVTHTGTGSPKAIYCISDHPMTEEEWEQARCGDGD